MTDGIFLYPELAPLTFAWGFLEAPFHTVRAALMSQLEVNTPKVEVMDYEGTLDELLQKLVPLTIPPTKELLTRTVSQWTAYFDNGAQGGEPSNRVSFLARILKCRGVAITCVPDIEGKTGRGIPGGIIFNLLAPESRYFLNYERSVGVLNDGKWKFIDEGSSQPFEQPDSYKNRRIKDRFSPALLEEYCAALGIRAADPSFYGPHGSILERVHPQWGGVKLSLLEARERVGITS